MKVHKFIYGKEIGMDRFGYLAPLLGLALFCNLVVMHVIAVQSYLVWRESPWNAQHHGRRVCPPSCKVPSR